MDVLTWIGTIGGVIGSLAGIGAIFSISQSRKETKKLAEETMKKEGYKQRCDEEIRQDVNNLAEQLRNTDNKLREHENVMVKLSTGIDWIQSTLSEIKQKLN